MIRSIFFLFVIFPTMFSHVRGQEIKPAIIKAEDLVKRYANNSDTTYVINFWATWCEPCVKELPYFEQLNEIYAAKKVKVMLVSLDFLNDYESRLIKFVGKKKLRSEVMLLNETKPNEFINKIDPRWQGSIPATMIINKEQQYSSFFEKPLSYEFLEIKIKALVGDSLR